VSNAKRDRQRANRAAKVAAQREAARKRRNRNLMLGVAGVAIVIAAIAVFSAVGEDAPGTTAAFADPDDFATDSTDAETSNGEDGADDAGATTSPAAPANSEYAAFRSQPTACGGEPSSPANELSFGGPEDLGLSGTVDATIETSCGPIEIQLDADAAPETVNSFAFLANQGYFDGTACHRISPGFVVQCGDPTAQGTGGPGYTIADEFPEEGFVYETGVVAMANAGAGTTGSQFFIVTGDASFLPASYSVLGQVVGSEDTLAALDAVPVGPNLQGSEISRPEEAVYIESVTVDAG
jgi:peptidyl-prolyl cis-trans isomerase B (cyclophilin B)